MRLIEHLMITSIDSPRIIYSQLNIYQQIICFDQSNYIRWFPVSFILFLCFFWCS